MAVGLAVKTQRSGESKNQKIKIRYQGVWRTFRPWQVGVSGLRTTIMDEHARRLLKNWARQLWIIHAEVRSLLRGSKIFWELQKIFENNPEALRHRLFNDWIATNYGVTTAIGIRRQLDLDKRSVSLKGLLLQIKAELVCHPDLLSRQKFVTNYPPELVSVAQREFDRLVGIGETRVGVAYVQRDLDHLDAITQPIKHFANKRVAHRDMGDVEKRRLGELDDCLQALGDMADRYPRILTGSGSTVVPELPPDWKSVFRIPWIQ